MTDAERIARDLPEPVRAWVADWPEMSLTGDWWWSAKDADAKPRWLWHLTEADCLRWNYSHGRKVYQWTELGLAVALAASQPQGGE